MMCRAKYKGEGKMLIMDNEEKLDFLNRLELQ